MMEIRFEKKFKKAAEVICRQGMFPFPVSDTAIAIVTAVVGDNEEELDLIYAFRETSSQRNIQWLMVHFPVDTGPGRSLRDTCEAACGPDKESPSSCFR